MPDFFQELNALENEESRNEDSLMGSVEAQNSLQYMGLENKEEETPDPSLDMSSDISADAELQEKDINRSMADFGTGAISTQAVEKTQNLEYDPTTWSPEYTMKSFAEETGSGVMRGLGRYVVKGTGDLFQLAGSWAGFDLAKGNMISRALQESGNEIANDFKTYLPEELLDENLTLGSMMNPQFWSKKASEFIPQIAEFVFLSKGGGALARKGAGALAKKAGGKGLAQGATKTAIGQEVFGTGKGVAGKLMTDRGLTALGSGVSEAIGGGVTSNLLSGMMNAADVVNTYKDMQDADGNPLYSEEDLSKMASGTMRNNAGYLLYDIASWGMTYGGGWKALKGFNPLAKGGKVHTAAERSKIASNLFRNDVSPIVKNLAKYGGKIGMEGLEETFQETYEEWAKMKAVSDVTGKPMEHDNYWDFYMSDENRPTRVISAALGGMGAGAFNVSTLFNKKADETYRLHDRMKNLSEITKNHGSETEKSWQKYHIRQSIADLVIADKTDLYEDFSNKLLENGNIDENQKAQYDEMLNNFKEVKRKGEILNVKGLSALMHNVSTESYADEKISEFEEIAKSGISEIESFMTLSDEKLKGKKVKEIQDLFEARLKALSQIKAEAKQNQENLILGKEASPLSLNIELDKFGNEMVIGGLSAQQAKDYTLKKGETLEKNIKDIEDQKGLSLKAKTKALAEEGADKMGKLSGLTGKAKQFAQSIFDKFKKGEASIDEETDLETEDNIQENEQQKDNDEEQASGTAVVNGEEVQTPKTQEEANEEANQKVTDAVVYEGEENDKASEGQDYANYDETGLATKQQLRGIAKKISSKEPLTKKEDEIRRAYDKEVRSEIASEILDTQKDFSEEEASELVERDATDEELEKQAEEELREQLEEEGLIDPNLSDEESSFVKDFLKETSLTEDEVKELEKRYGVTIDKDKDGKLNIKGDNTKKAMVDAGKIMAKKTGLKAKKAAKKGLDKAVKGWKASKKKIKNAASKMGMDKREGKRTFKRNLRDQETARNFLRKIRKEKNSEPVQISQNEIDNYLNRFTTYNLYGPSAIDQMAVVNHHLKNMFPNSNDPAQAIIVRNLFDSVGSVGLATTMGATMFIDEKSWNQDDVFMHELSHIYYRLANDEETQKILNLGLSNPKLVGSIKKKYDDYTLFEFDVDGEGNFEERTKGQLIEDLKAVGWDNNAIENFFDDYLKTGDLKTVPFENQRYILEEIFTATLEGPLAEQYDKIFEDKREPRRQETVKKFWGLIKKKGAIIQEDGLKAMLEKATGQEVPFDVEKHLYDTFRNATEGVKIDSFGLDARANAKQSEINEALDEINARRKSKINNVHKNKGKNKILTEQEIDDEIDNLLEEGEAFFDDGNTDKFANQIKSATRLMKRFGTVYQKAVRERNALIFDNKSTNYKKQKTFDKELFESMLYNLASESRTPDEFIYNLENSAIEEVKQFNKFIKKVYPETDDQLLSSMHYVFSNSKHVIGFSNSVKDNGQYDMRNSLSQREITMTDNILDSLREERGTKDQESTEMYKRFDDAVHNIYNGSTETDDFLTVIRNLTDYNSQGSHFNLEKLLEQGVINFRGMTLPIETVVAGYIKRGYMFNQRNPKKGINVYNSRALVEAFVATNRKFTPFSSVKNAEGNLEPVRIVNNNITKEVDDIIDFLSPDSKGKKPTLEQFLDRYSHLSEEREPAKANQFLVNMYNDFEKGILPTISQYHGLQDLSNRKGSLYKNSTATQQGLEEFLTFVSTSRSGSKNKNNTYLGSVGTFSDSPRKFFMNMKRIPLEEMFTYKGDKLQFKGDGKMLNSIFAIHNKMFDDKLTNNKRAFREEFKNAIKETSKFIKSNEKQLAKIDKLKPYLDKSGRMKGKAVNELIVEYAMNSVINGYNTTEVFLPLRGLKDNQRAEVVKRFKMNSSPVFSIKNPNLKIEPVLFADTIIDGSISGSDSGMFITKRMAEKLRNVGKGVFEMNHGFKLLNASVEKDNPKFKGKAAYLKGYTTVVDESHPLHKILTERENKFIEKYKAENNGAEPSWDFTDGTINQMVVAMPISVDKSNFFGKELYKKNDDGVLEYTEEGLKLTPEALANDTAYANKLQDDLFYANKGKGQFRGIDGYNFGPQQLMDKQKSTSNMPVQLVNSIIVNSMINGKTDLTNEILEHISKQKQFNMNKLISSLNEQTAEDFKRVIEEGLNKEDMDQGQRILFEDGGSIATPYLQEIMSNQMNKSIRVAGNKLETPGTVAHQKSDIGFGRPLKGYVNLDNDGQMEAAEIALPSHMSESSKDSNGNTISAVEPRKEFTIYTHEDELNTFALNSKTGKPGIDEELASLKSLAVKYAKRRALLETGDSSRFEEYLRESKNEKDQVIGYYVKGEHVLASRVPAHGPSSTGVFEVVGFDKGEGNQVMVPTEFNDITGGDNDGDALFIQTKGDKKEFGEWNEAFKKIKQYWLSPEMKDQIRAKIEIKEQAENAIKEIEKQFPQSKSYVFPFSPEQKLKDYNNTMVSKRNVGPIFNLHKVANMLAAYEVKTSKSFTISRGAKNPVKTNYDGFYDVEKGANSRNQQSAILANIILDNAKHGYADTLGLDEHNVAQAALLINMGVPLVDIGKILNSKAAKMWSELNRNNNSLFHENVSRDKIAKEALKRLKISPNDSMEINTDLAHEDSQQAAIINLFGYMSDMNSEIQKISKIMSGHKGIHVNPLVLQNELKDFNEVMKGTDNSTLKITDDFKTNKDLRNYAQVAETALKINRKINPVYRESTNKLLSSFTPKVRESLSSKQIESISDSFKLFNTSRLLGLNNSDRKYVEELMDSNNENSIYKKLDRYLKELKKITPLSSSVLFSKAMNFQLRGNDIYISANPRFVNESFNELDRKAAQEEFEELPEDLQDDLIMHDLITRGWKDKLSLAPYFGKLTNDMINMASDYDISNKNNEISPVVLKELERRIALKMASESNNPFEKVYVDNKLKVDDQANVIKKIIGSSHLRKRLASGEPMYINVRRELNVDEKRNLRNASTEVQRKAILNKANALYKLDAFEPIDSERSYERNIDYSVLEAGKHISLIPNDMNYNPNVDIALISDKNVFDPLKTSRSYKNNKSKLDPMVEATIKYENLKGLREKIKKGGTTNVSMDAREDFDSPLFESETPLTLNHHIQAMEYNPYTSQSVKEDMYRKYEKAKLEANKEAKKILPTLDSKTEQELMDMYEEYGEKDVYAYSIIMTPIVKKLANVIASEQSELTKKEFKGKDIDTIKAYLLTGSTIPSDHPASQAMARRLETEFKHFQNEKKKYVSEMNKITDALYKERLGYSSERSIKNTALRVRDLFTMGKEAIYDRLYGRLVVREEVVGKDGKITHDFRLKPKEEIERDFKSGFISKAEKDFYDYFRKTTSELMPKGLKKKKEDYIPHTSMTAFEMLSNRGLLGLMVNSRNDEEALYDVKLRYRDSDGKVKMMNFKTIEDMFKGNTGKVKKNDLATIKEYMALKSKAKKLLKEGNNEDGTPVRYSNVTTETALGFGAINRFARNRSVKATELPSMDLNKALGDYIHSTLFVEGNERFQGFKRLQSLVDGVLAYNREANMENMNIHVQKVWKDYFLRNKRQESVLGKKADRVIRGLTRLNLLYALGYGGFVKGGGTYAIGNVLSGKYHNIKDLGGKNWIKGEARYWGLDKGFKNGAEDVLSRKQRMNNIMTNLNFMEINVYDEVNIEKKSGLDSIFTNLALAPMIHSEKWIQQVHMLGLLTDEELDRFDENGNYKPTSIPIRAERIIELEDQVKRSHGRGYQPTDQRAIQLYSWGQMMLQFSRFLPTMFQDRFAKKDVNIYGKETIGSLRAVGHMIRPILNNPAGYVEYRNKLAKESPEQLKQLDKGLKGMAMAAVISLISAGGSESAHDLFMDTNYYWANPKLAGKVVPPAIKSTENLVNKLF